MSDHVHNWIVVTNFGTTSMLRFCQACTERQMLTPDDWKAELEQQLADAQAKITSQEKELRILAAQRQDYKAQVSEAKALLKEAYLIIESEEGDYSSWVASVLAFSQKLSL